MLEGEKTLGLPTVGEGIDFVMVVPHTASWPPSTTRWPQAACCTSPCTSCES